MLIGFSILNIVIVYICKYIFCVHGVVKKECVIVVDKFFFANSSLIMHQVIQYMCTYFEF